MLRLHFLGTSDSAGMPVSHCFCQACQEYRQKGLENLATSAYLEFEDGVVLLDAGHENLATKMRDKKIKACFLTHFHPDHAQGLLRLRYSSQNFTCYHPDDKEGFSDLFKHAMYIQYRVLAPYENIEIDGVCFTAIKLLHSKTTNGYVIESGKKKIAYLTDCARIEPRELEFLKSKKLDMVFIDACFDERVKKGNHLNYISASKILDYIEAKEGYLMHLSHQTKSYIMENSIKTKYPYVEVGESFIVH